MLISTLFLFPLHNPPSQQSICFSYEKPFSNNYRRSAHGVECARYNGEMRAALVPSHRFVVARVFHLYLHNLKIFPHLNMIKVIKRRLTLRLRLHSESSKIRKFFFSVSTLSTLLGATRCVVSTTWQLTGRSLVVKRAVDSSSYHSHAAILCAAPTLYTLYDAFHRPCVYGVCVKNRSASASQFIVRYYSILIAAKRMRRRLFAFPSGHDRATDDAP